MVPENNCQQDLYTQALTQALQAPAQALPEAPMPVVVSLPDLERWLKDG